LNEAAGAADAIGHAAAKNLAERGARIVQIARNPERGDAALKTLREHGPGAAHSMYYADLSRISEMKRVSAEIAAAEPRIDG
jgi:short-subunit dehydrogenase